MIKKSFRKLAHQYHPDKNQDNPNAHQYFQEILLAYETLSDDRKRKKYDQELWLNGTEYHKKTPKIDKDTLLFRAAQLYAKLQQQTSFFDLEKLRDYIASIITDQHLFLLHKNASEAELIQFVTQILYSTQLLPYQYFDSLLHQLTKLTQPFTSTQALLLTSRNARKTKDFLQQHNFVIISLVGMLIFVMMLWYAKK